MKRTLLSMTLIGAGVALAITGMQLIPSYAKDEEKQPQPKIAVDDTPVQREGSFTTSFAPVVKKAGPSVVNIFTTKVIRERESRMNPFFDNPMFRDFFERGERPRRNQREQSLGSGVIVSPEGHILTSNHVVEGADEIKIVLATGREYTAKVIGTDPPTDTAVLKVEASDLPAITLGNSDKLEVGDVVLAIGNPFGIGGQTVTMGIVSATGRTDLGIVDYEDFIQTDASINPGNSGGALVDAQGRLVGINTAILSRTGGNQGVGFAIPINLSRSIMERLISGGKVMRGFLGVGLQQLTPDLAGRFGIKDSTAGALVTGVEEGTPAAEAGFKPGDVIVEFNGKKIADSKQLRLLVSQTPPKSKVSFKVLREGKTRTYNVTLAALPTERTLSGMIRPGAPEESENETLDGVEVGDLDSRGRRQGNIPNHINGALVTNVDPDSTAYEAGLRPGDVILEMEKKPITSAEEAVEMSNTFQGDNILLRIWRRGGATYLTVPVERKNKDKSDKPAPDKEEN